MMSSSVVSKNDALNREVPVERLALDAQHGNAEAFERLLSRFRPRLRVLIRRYYGAGANRDDFAQEAAIGFFKAVRDFQPDKSTFHNFVDVCVQRQLISFIKSLQRKKHINFNEARSLDAPIRIREGLPYTLQDELGIPPSYDWIEREAQQAFFTVLLNRCTPLERKVLYEYGEGYSYVELADRCHMSVKSIDNALQRAKTKARKLIREQPHFVDDFRKVITRSTFTS